VLLMAACSRGAEHGPSAPDLAGMADAMADDARVVPANLSIAALAGGNGVLDVIALTLRRGSSSTEVYAALRNDGETPACSAAFSVELFDKTEHSLATGIAGLLTQHFYRRTDGSGALAACVGPGDVSMAAVTDLPSDIDIEDVGYARYRCPYFALDVVPSADLTVSAVTRTIEDGGSRYTGKLVNGLDVTVSKPSVTVFPVNAVGRPLGVAAASSFGEVPPGGSWIFETNTLDAIGADWVAYPAGELVH
jgi:hypothetical protein